jgi:hypothetical protein
MRRLRAFTAHSPTIVISIIAVVFSLGGGAYPATTLSGRQIATALAAGSQIAGHRTSTAPLPATSFSWHRLTLINGWKPVPGGLSFGHPSYAISGGVVYLRGALHQPVPGNPQFAILPSGARPAHLLDIIILTAFASSGALVIDPNGRMEAAGANATTFTSLAAVSFPRSS